VASNSDGIPEVVEDGVTGLLFERENVQGLQQKLALLINDGGLRRWMGAKGKARVADLFTVKAYVARVQEEILQTVVPHSRAN
jgi:glycosyltransferase involved in cell wall biosynthesis